MISMSFFGLFIILCFIYIFRGAMQVAITNGIVNAHKRIKELDDLTITTDSEKRSKNL